MLNNKPNQNNLKNKDERKLALLKAQQEKEKMFKLMVKIISWESGSLDSNTVRSENKITQKEWLEYKKQRMSIATIYDKDKAKKKLTLTFNSIKANGGFE